MNELPESSNRLGVVVLETKILIMTTNELITKDDLMEFKKEMLSEIRMLITPQKSQVRQWLRSSEVRAMLNISSGTLQNMRINGILSFNKVGGIMYYKFEEITKMMEGK